MRTFKRLIPWNGLIYTTMFILPINYPIYISFFYYMPV